MQSLRPDRDPPFAPREIPAGVYKRVGRSDTEVEAQACDMILRGEPVRVIAQALGIAVSDFVGLTGRSLRVREALAAARDVRGLRLAYHMGTDDRFDEAANELLNLASGDTECRPGDQLKAIKMLYDIAAPTTVAPVTEGISAPAVGPSVTVNVGVGDRAAVVETRLSSARERIRGLLPTAPAAPVIDIDVEGEGDPLGPSPSYDSSTEG